MTLSEVQELWGNTRNEFDEDGSSSPTEKVSFHLGEYGTDQSISNLELGNPVPLQQKLLQQHVKFSLSHSQSVDIEVVDPTLGVENLNVGESCNTSIVKNGPRQVKLSWAEGGAKENTAKGSISSRIINRGNNYDIGEKFRKLISGCYCANVYINDGTTFNPLYDVQIVNKGVIRFEPIYLESGHKKIVYVNLDEGYTRGFNIQSKLMGQEEEKLKKAVRAFVDGLVQICQETEEDKIKDFIQLQMTELNYYNVS